MAVLAVIGGQWGDEGKGKIVDMLGEQCQLVIRYNGGNNAGHTVVNQFGTFRMHLVPSGIFSPQTTCLIGNGVVVNPRALLEELAEVGRAGVPLARLFISDRAHVIMPYHLRLDQLEEESRGSGSIGTTGRGIGPAYADKFGRLGLRVGDLLDERVFRDKLAFILEIKNRVLTRLYGAEPLALETVYQEYCGYARELRPYVADASAIVQQALSEGRNVLLEGAQGTMLDVDFGTYPFVTSSSVIAAGAYTGAGLPPRYPLKCLGVFKAYSSRVGSGPFPSELHDTTADRIRTVGHEYGTTTGRPRRIGWFDAVASRFASRLNGLDAVALTRLDVLDGLPTVRICTAYRYGGDVLGTVPASVDVLRQCEPIYEELPGWEGPLSETRAFADLPANARRYVERIEELLSCAVEIVSVGPRREQTIRRRNLFLVAEE